MEDVATLVLTGSIGILTVSLIGVGLVLLALLRALRGVHAVDRAQAMNALQVLASARVGALVSNERGSRESVLLVREEDYAGLEETVYLLSDPANNAHLTRSIEQLELARARYGT